MIILISLSVRFRGQKYAKADIGKRVTVTGKQEPTRSTRARAEWHENERGQSRAESGGGDIKKENMEQEKEGGRGVGLKKRRRQRKRMREREKAGQKKETSREGLLFLSVVARVQESYGGRARFFQKLTFYMVPRPKNMFFMQNFKGFPMP